MKSKLFTPPKKITILAIGPIIGEFYYDVLYSNPGYRNMVKENDSIIPFYIGMESRYFLYADFIKKENVIFLDERFDDKSNQFKTRNKLLRRSSYKRLVNQQLKKIRLKYSEYYNLKQSDVQILSIDQTHFFDSDDRPITENFQSNFEKIKIHPELDFIEDKFLDILIFVPDDPSPFSSTVDEHEWTDLFYHIIKNNPDLKIGLHKGKSCQFISNNCDIDISNIDISNVCYSDITLALLYKSTNIIMPTTEWDVILNLAKKSFMSFGQSKFLQSQYSFDNINKTLIIPDHINYKQIYNNYLKMYLEK